MNVRTGTAAVTASKQWNYLIHTKNCLDTTSGGVSLDSSRKMSIHRPTKAEVSSLVLEQSGSKSEEYPVNTDQKLVPH